MEETAFAIGAFCVAAAIIGGGLKAAHVWDMPVVDSIPRQFLLGVFGAILMVWSVTASGSDSSGTTASDAASSNGASSQATSPAGSESAGTDGSGTAADADGCRITIANPLATLMEQPDTFSREIGRVPAGVYEVEAVEDVTFGPETQRWFRITVEGRAGFVRDSTFTVEAKSSDCP